MYFPKVKRKRRKVSYILVFIIIIAIFNLILYYKFSGIEEQIPDLKCIISQNDDNKFITVSSDRKWNLITDSLREVLLEVKLDSRLLFYEKKEFTYILQNEKDVFTGVFSGLNPIINYSNIPVGKYSLQIKVDTDCGPYYSEKIDLIFTEPFYVVWTHDWEGWGPSFTYLDKIDKIAATYNMPTVQFFNPRIYYTYISDVDANKYTDWVKKRKGMGDEIALHLHMHKDMLEAWDIDVIDDGRTDKNAGHGTPMHEYSYEEVNKILTISKKIFIEKGLGIPKGFRAGGYKAGMNVLFALEKNGFNYDSSARTEISFFKNDTLWHIDPFSFPYYPSIDNQNVAGYNMAHSVSVLEFPVIGGDTRQNVLVQTFDNNYLNGVFEEIKVLPYLTHPVIFYKDEANVIELFDYITNNHMYRDDNGAVIFSTFENIYNLHY